MVELPEDIKQSKILNSEDLKLLEQAPGFPDETEVNEYKLLVLSEIFIKFEDHVEMLEEALHKIAKKKLSENNIEEAWKVLLAFND